MDVIICARGGSSRVKRKNIRDFCGKPLITHSIEFARKLDFIKNIHINSDDTEILNIASKYNCLAYERPKNLGSGNVFVIDVIREMIRKKDLKNHNFVVMFPTVPLRIVEDFTAGYQLFEQMNHLKQVISVSPAPYPYQVALNIENNLVRPIFPDCYVNSTRHTDYDTVYHANYSFVFSSGKALLTNKTLIEHEAFAVVTHPMSSIDIDDEFQFTTAQALYKELFQ